MSNGQKRYFIEPVNALSEQYYVNFVGAHAFPLQHCEDVPAEHMLFPFLKHYAQAYYVVGFKNSISKTNANKRVC